ncbi:hypothetical protein QYE76_048430 [Lolium multiflorum]|uniref:Uncharacterized protein n=1 Tax=Lolium multiflorum TaxID=4521 RepID=A0AAD8SKU5_LOLMU|nr:hypothetical protein QYE76_048430 [Lolium multiflorum]
MDMWQMLDKFRAEVIDSSSDEESDQSTQTLATTAASMIHEFTSNEGRVEGQLRLHKDYFHLIDPVFKEKMFRRRYRMSRELFLVILWGVRNYDPYFQCRPMQQYYCKKPNVEDTRRLLSINESRGFPGMIDGIDCMHWK